MNKLKIMEWNINQRSNYNKVNFIPDFIAEEINKPPSDIDIIIITEFYKVIGWENFVGSLASYNTFVTENPKNEVLIAVKKKHAIESVYSWISSYNKCYPDYLEVNIKYNKNIISIIGVRILVDRYTYNNSQEVSNEMKCRYKQNVHILERIEQLQKKGRLIIGAGDFNTGRKENPNKDWSRNILKSELSLLDIALYTPYGNSYQPYKDDYGGCPDHIFASRNISVKDVPYDWSFVDYDNDIYIEGERTRNIPSPYPDHAILRANIEI